MAEFSDFLDLARPLLLSSRPLGSTPMKGRFGWVLWSPPHRPFLVSGLCFQQFLQLPALEHLHHDVGAADELALHIKLRNGRPVAERLDPLADLGVLEHVDGLVLRSKTIEDRDRAAREAALR